MEDRDMFRDQNLVSYEPKSMKKQMKRYCRLMDLYAIPITLRYKNEKKFYTNFGAATSCVVISVILGLLLSEILQISNKSVIETQINQQLLQNRQEKGIQANFNFGFTIVDEDNNAYDDPEVISPKVMRVALEEGSKEAVEDELPFSSCNFTPDYFKLEHTNLVVDKELDA